jgi:NADPH2:quinone reductase
MPRAVVCREPGPLEQLGFEQVPSRAPRPGEVRVRLHAIGVNFPDLLIVQNLYQYKPPLPFTPGVEAAGVVAEIGPGVPGLDIGDPVIARMRTGAYAEEVLVPADALVRLPEGLSFAEGACLLVSNLTAMNALVQSGRLVPGEVLLVHGAGGGVGLAAVEIGKRLGAHVIATASSDAKLAIAKARGADHAINYLETSFVDQVKHLTAGKGADVIYDPVGGDVFTQSLRCIAWAGRLLVVGFASGTIPQVAVNRILLKGCAVIGVRAGEAARHDPEVGRKNLADILALVAAGALKPHISHIVPLERYADAMRLLAERKAIGRVVLAATPQAEVVPLSLIAR